jgi:hypothetical protein
MINEVQKQQLIWMPALGIGYYPVTESPYNEKYFNRYVEQSKTPIGLALNKARIDLVNKYTDKDVLDIGIGSGAFVEARPNTYGMDINETAVKWLNERDKFRHFLDRPSSMTFWDSLEHIHNPKYHIKSAREFIFVSMPIYKDLDHLMGSKHLRYDEHCWYFTEDALKKFMLDFGFECVEVNTMETDIGREDITTFVFKRL